MSDTVALNRVFSSVCPISNVGTNTLPAQELGVPLFCALYLGTATISAQELGVNSTVLYETTSVSYVDANSVSAQELGVPLSHAQNSDAVDVFIPDVLNYSETTSDIFIFLNASESSLLSDFTASIVDHQYPHFILQGNSKKGLFKVDHSNVGVFIVTCVLRLLTDLFWLVGYVLHILALLLRYLYVGFGRVLIFFTPRAKWWPQYLYRLNLLVINCCFTLHKTVAEKCRRVRAFLLRSLFRRYDFLVFQVSICKVRRFTAIFIIASCMLPMLDCVRTLFVTVVSDASSLQPDLPSYEHVGGGRIPLFGLEELLPHVNCSGKIVTPESNLRFIGHKHKNVAEALYGALGDHVYGKVPIDGFVDKLTIKDAKSIAKIHGLHVPSKIRAENIASLFKGHLCACCDSYMSIFALHSVKSNAAKSKQWYAGLDTSQKKHKQERQKNNGVSAKQKLQNAKSVKAKREAARSKIPDFPPPPSKDLQETIALNWCEDTSPDNFMEGGCAVCGQLCPYPNCLGCWILDVIWMC